MEYYSTIKKEWNNAIWSYIIGPRDYHTNWSKLNRERHIPRDTTCMLNLKYGTNELIYETETDRHIEQICGCQVGDSGGWIRSLGLADENFYI